MQPFLEWHPVIQALAGGLFTWGVTALGSLPVLFVRRMSHKLLDAMLGMAAGVMMAASFWSLLAPAIEMSEKLGRTKWLPAAVGFVLGAVCIRIVDALLPHLHPCLDDRFVALGLLPAEASMDIGHFHIPDCIANSGQLGQG